MKKEDSMRDEYDLSSGERGKFFGKVDTIAPVIDDDDLDLGETFEEELYVLESNLDRIKSLKSRISELEPSVREKITRRMTTASEILDEIALSR